VIAMHERALIDDLLHRVLATAAAENATRVTGVTVWLGALSHLTTDHFADHFARAAAGTIAEGAMLHSTTSHDIGDPHAAEVVLQAVEVDA
jgi:hydrogenase nickel incorporation protein HypA/HybF